MNIAIVIGVSKYPGQEIIAQKKDAYRINQLLEATEKYENILCITEDTVAATVKAQIRSFLQSYDKQEIEEVFYYFSGHGIFEDQEFYMLCSDYEKSKRNTTSLQNSEIDSFIRVLEPKLTVKVIDACFSGYRYIKDDSFASYGNISSEKTLENVIFMASSHDDQKSQMMGETSYFTEKFIEGALSVTIGGKVLYRDIQGFIADEFGSMITQRPFFTTQGTGTEVFAEYTEVMQALKEEWNLEPIPEMLAEGSSKEGQDDIQIETLSLDDEQLVEETDKILAKKDTVFVEETVIKTNLENIRKAIFNYQLDQIVSAFYQIHFNWDRKLSDLAKNTELLNMANSEKWSQEYFIELGMRTRTVREPVPSWQKRLLGYLSEDTREVKVQEPTSLKTVHSLPYEVIWIEFQPINKLSIAPFFAIIALVHSETHVLTLLHRGMMIKDSWRHFAVDWDSLKWNRQEFLWKDIIENPHLLWEMFLKETIQELREYLVALIPRNSVSAIAHHRRLG